MWRYRILENGRDIEVTVTLTFDRRRITHSYGWRAAIMPRASANRPGRSHKNPDDDGRKAEGEAPVVTVTTSNYLMLAERYLISSREQLETSW